MAGASELHCFRALTPADIVLDLDDAESEGFIVHQMADDEAQVAFGPAGLKLETALCGMRQIISLFERRHARQDRRLGPDMVPM